MSGWNYLDAIFLPAVMIRLLIQQCLIRSAYDESLERSHDQDFVDKVKIVKAYGFFDEFLDALKEEEQGLQKLIEAYDKRVDQSR